MKRPMMLFGGLLLVGSLLWPWLREMGLARLPGDVAFDWQGIEFHLPIATAALITVVLVGVWRMLDRN
jgi:hypothetical protein